MQKTFDIAVVGATGIVGEAVLNILAERNFPVENIYALASENSAGKTIQFQDEWLEVENIVDFDFSKVQIAFFSAGSSVSAEYAPHAAAAGCVVIDNTSEFRYDDEIPLIVPEVNASALENYQTRNIIANPNCSTIQMVVALKPIHKAVGITRINVTTFQSVSGAGQQGLEELAMQTARLLNGQPVKSSKIFSRQIAFNIIPHIDDFQDNGYTREEMKMVWETRKILQDESIEVNPTCVRIPVFFGHSEAVHLEIREKISAKTARQLLQKAPGVVVVDKRAAGGYPTPVSDAAGQDAVFVGRIREDISHPNGLNMWVVSDNVRKGGALNAVQIAELLVAKYL